MQQPFDLVGIGAGPAGIAGATTASALVLRVALVSGMKTRNFTESIFGCVANQPYPTFLCHERPVKAGPLSPLANQGQSASG